MKRLQGKQKKRNKKIKKIKEKKKRKERTFMGDANYKNKNWICRKRKYQ